MVRDLLPIGSVVLLKDAVKRLVITGVKPTVSDDSSFDYIGVLYPEGKMGEESEYLFNHDQIDKVYFKGFEDEERTAFIDKLAEFFGE